MLTEISAGLAMYVFVALKAAQQRNVAFDHYWPIMPFSLAMAFSEVYVISVIVRVGYDLMTTLSIGIGAGFGAITAMYLHKRVFGSKIFGGKKR